VTLSPDESRRYARHIVLKGFGGAAQQKLKDARVLIVGAGGLGAPVIAYLAAAGIGRMTIVDDDDIALSNLQRQILFESEAQGRSKVQAAADFVAARNAHVETVQVRERLSSSNALSLVAGHDLVIDGSDSFDTRSAVADACERARIPLVSGAVTTFDGNVTVLMPYRDELPDFRSLYPDAPGPGDVPPCEQTGVLGPLVGVIGTMMAVEAVKVLTGIGEPLVGRLALYSARTGEMTMLRYQKRKPAPKA
jgi:molybdopterin-synthase adenylyltransferase